MGYCITKSGPIPYENRAVCEGPGVNGTFYTNSEYKAREEQLRRMDTLDKDTDAYYYGDPDNITQDELKRLKNLIAGKGLDTRKIPSWLDQPSTTSEYDTSVGGIPFIPNRDTALKFLGKDTVNHPQGMPFGTKYNQGSRVRPVQYTPDTRELYATGKLPDGSGDTQGTIPTMIRLQNLQNRFDRNTNAVVGGTKPQEEVYNNYINDVDGIPIPYIGPKKDETGKTIVGDTQTPRGFFSGMEGSSFNKKPWSPPISLQQSSESYGKIKNAFDKARAVHNAPVKQKPKEITWKDKIMRATPGGSGGWDNPMYRIGELMREMDAPGSWGLDGRASDRWSTAAAAEAKNTALTGKNAMAAQAKIDKDKMDLLIKMADINPTHLATSIQEFIPSELNDSWFRLDTAEKESIAMEIAIRAQQAMLQAASDTEYLPYNVAMKLAANQMLKEKNK